jgi:hypothetical protein
LSIDESFNGLVSPTMKTFGADVALVVVVVVVVVIVVVLVVVVVVATTLGTMSGGDLFTFLFAKVAE